MYGVKFRISWWEESVYCLQATPFGCLKCVSGHLGKANDPSKRALFLDF